jgi:hypothetical protein
MEITVENASPNKKIKGNIIYFPFAVKKIRLANKIFNKTKINKNSVKTLKRTALSKENKV